MNEPTQPGYGTGGGTHAREPLSCTIICCDEEEGIRAALESVKWCDEIVVVDSFSTDRTVEICREYTDRIYQRPWPGFVEQKAFALEQARCAWVLSAAVARRHAARRPRRITSSSSSRIGDQARTTTPRHRTAPMRSHRCGRAPG